MQSDLSLFIGRFHPLIVHLPIGILLLAVIIHFLSSTERFKTIKPAVPILLVFGLLGAIASAIAGLLLAEDGGYSLEVLDQHKWMGFTMILVNGVLLFWISKKNSNPRVTGVLMVVVLLLVSVTGHLGGTLTHGDRYLFEYAPGFIRNQVLTDVSLTEGLPQDSDSVLLYHHFIQPILDSKCINCHQEGNLSGGLNLTHLDSMKKGGETAEALVSQQPLSSEIFRRVTLDPRDRKYMPPNGDPLSFVETLLIKEWIEQDMDTTLSITDPRVSEELKAMVTRYYKVDTRSKEFIEKLTLPEIPEETLEQIRSNGFQVRVMLSNLLDVKAKDSLNSEQLSALVEVGDHIVWLDLSNAGIEQNDLKNLSSLKNLSRLFIQGNAIDSIDQLGDCEHLEVLNLHSTLIEDAQLETLSQMKNLKKVYLWQTKVSAEAVEDFKRKRPEVEVNFGSQIEVIKPEKEEEIE